MTDESLVERHLAGDHDAFNQLAARHQDRLYRLAYRLIGNHEDALDAVQEVLLRLLRALPSFRGEARFSTWLYRLAANTCVDCRRQQRAPRTEALHADLPDDTPEQDPDHQCEKGFRTTVVEHALRELPDDQRLVLVLRDLEGLSNPAAAEVLGIEVGTLKARLHRARGALRRVMDNGVVVAGHEQIGRVRFTPAGELG